MSKTHALAVEVAPTKNGSARKPSEIGRLMEKVEEFCQIRRLVDRTIIGMIVPRGRLELGQVSNVVCSATA